MCTPIHSHASLGACELRSVSIIPLLVIMSLTTHVRVHAIFTLTSSSHRYLGKVTEYGSVTLFTFSFSFSFSSCFSFSFICCWYVCTLMGGRRPTRAGRQDDGRKWSEDSRGVVIGERRTYTSSPERCKYKIRLLNKII